MPDARPEGGWRMGASGVEGVSIHGIFAKFSFVWLGFRFLDYKKFCVEKIAWVFVSWIIRSFVWRKQLGFSFLGLEEGKYWLPFFTILTPRNLILHPHFMQKFVE